MVTKDDQEAASWIANEVRKAGGRLSIQSSTLLSLFIAEQLDDPTRQRITQALSERDLHCVPELRGGQVGADDEVTIVASERVPVDRHEDDLVPVALKPTPVSPAATLASEAAVLPAGAIAAGAAVPGVLLAAVSLSTWWAFAVLFLVLAGTVWVVARRFRFQLARVFYFPLRSPWLAGFVLAALPLLLVSAVAGAVVVAPVATQRAEDDRRDQAQNLKASAERSLRDGDLEGARDKLGAARDKDAMVVGHDDLQRRIADEQRRRDEEVELARTYNDARSAVENNEQERALGILAGLNGYRDSDTLAAQARRDLASDHLVRARTAYRRGDFADARDAAQASVDIRSTQAATEVRARARAALEAERDRARARARARAEAEAQARADARERADQRRQEREAREEQRRREQESTPVVPDGGGGGGGGGCVNGVPFPEFEGQRDGDGDGCYGES